MDYKLFNKDPYEAITDHIRTYNSGLPSGGFVIGAITDLGAAANPNTSATIIGDGINCQGEEVITFNRLHPKNTFGKFGAVVKRPVIDAIGMATIIAESTATALGGSVVAAINAKLATLGIGVTFPSTVALVDQTVAELLTVAPSSHGQNPEMSRVVVISTVGMIHDDTIEVGATLALHIA